MNLLLEKVLFIIQIIIIILLICLLTISGFFLETNNIYNGNYNPIIYNHLIKNTLNTNYNNTEEYKLLPNDIIIKYELDNFIKENMNIIEFYSNTFQIDKNYIINKIYTMNNEKININNIFKLSDEYTTFDEQIFNYITLLLDTNPELFSNDLILINPSKEYVLNLVDYYNQFFPLVDPAIAKSIIHIESGFTAPSMLSKNNLFGGMAGGKLISYKSIEYGIYSYMKLLQNSYFGVGLTTISTIGMKYNPIIENGVKTANPSWVSKVNSVINNYNTKNDITIENLLNIPIEK